MMMKCRDGVIYNKIINNVWCAGLLVLLIIMHHRVMLVSCFVVCSCGSSSNPMQLVHLFLQRKDGSCFDSDCTYVHIKKYIRS